MRRFPSESNYSYAGNNPITNVDKDGEYKIAVHLLEQYKKDYPMIMKYLEYQVEKDISNSAKIINGFIETNPNLKESSIKGIARWNSGPYIRFVDQPGEFPFAFKEAAGYTPTDPGIHEIQINASYAAYVEQVLKSDASDEFKLTAFTRFYTTLIHETGHDLNKYGKYDQTDENGFHFYERLPKGGYSSEEVGYKIEESIWGTENYKPFSGVINPDQKQPKGILGIQGPMYRPGVTEGVIREAQKTLEGKASLPTVPKP